MTCKHEDNLLTLALDIGLWDRPDRFAVGAKGDIYLCGSYLPEDVVGRLCKCSLADMLDEVAATAKQMADKMRGHCTIEAAS